MGNDSQSLRAALQYLLSESIAAWNGAVEQVTRTAVLEPELLLKSWQDKRSPLKVPFWEDGTYVFPLPPLQREENFVPLLSLKWSFVKKPPRGSIRVFMVPRDYFERRPEDHQHVYILRFDDAEEDADRDFS